MALIPPLEPAVESATHPVTGELCEVWDWVHAKITDKNRSYRDEKRKSVAIAFRCGKEYSEPLVLVIHEQPRTPRKMRYAAESHRRHIFIEWVRLSITEFISKGVMAEFLTHENDYIRNYFNLVAKEGVKLITTREKKSNEQLLDYGHPSV